MDRIMLAPDEGIAKFPAEEAIVLTALGHPNALVTDWSTVGDFYSFSDDETDKSVSLKLSRRFGFPVTMHTPILDICQFIHGRKRNV